MAGSDVFTGTLDVLILQSVSSEAKHGYAIGRWIRESSSEVLAIQEGVLYPALHRLSRKKWLKGSWGTSETGRRAKFYTLTMSGRKHLQREKERLARHSRAVLAVLQSSAT